MRYLLLIYNEEIDPSSVEGAPSPDEFAAYDAVTKEMRDTGAYLGGEALEPTSTATTVRVRDGQVQTTDGPFAETKEALGGYYLVDAKDLDEAIAWAARMPGARNGSIEVRPIWEFGAAAEPEPSAASGGVAG